MRFRKLSILLFGFGIVAGCGQPAKLKESAVTAKVMDFDKGRMKVLAGDFQIQDGNLVGKGTLQTARPVADLETEYDLSVSLELGESVTLVTYANENLEKGIEVRFTRAENDRLLLAVSSQGGPFEDSSKIIAGARYTAPLQLKVELHADHGHGFLHIQGLPYQEELEFTPAFDGKFWGVRLSKGILHKHPVARTAESKE